MDNGIISEKFDEWTKGLDPVKARIAVFEHVRDIPYSIVPELRAPDVGPSGILAMNKGSCQPKHWLLGLLFEKMGIPVKYASYPFKWYDPGIKWPPELIKIVKELPVTYHLACKAYIDGKWILVDATYDKGLESAGFTVNKNWDGVSATANSVKPLEEIIHESPTDRVSYETAQKARYTEKEKTLSAEFVEKLNAWLEEVRQGIK